MEICALYGNIIILFKMFVSHQCGYSPNNIFFIGIFTIIQVIELKISS